MSASFLGDGNSHTLGTGSNWSYQFVYDSAVSNEWVGQWTDSNVSAIVPVFEYAYATGQWYDQGLNGKVGSGFNVLGESGLSASFMGDGNSHTLGTGSSWSFQYAYDDYYDFWVGQWTDSNVISATPVYQQYYGNLSQSGIQWNNPGVSSTVPIFEYDYVDGYWLHQGPIASGGNFVYLGNQMTSAFVGDGSSHDLGSGSDWSYQYTYDSGNNVWVGQWTDSKVSSAVPLFEYAYATGQWYQQGVSACGYSLLGLTNQSPQLIDNFDGVYSQTSWISLDGYWYFRFHQDDTSGSPTKGQWVGEWVIGQWANLDLGGKVPVFEYDYATGQWYDQGLNGTVGSGFNVLGLGGMSACFIGDGNPHTLGTGSNWSYQYVDGVGHWTDSNVSSTVPLFEYVYATGQWYEQGIAGGGFCNLGPSGMSTSFLGDGTSHTLGTGSNWSYQYVHDTLVSNQWVGQWTDSNVSSTVPVFEYAYAISQWYDQGAAGGGFCKLGSSGLLASFLGDGNLHTLGTGSNWAYQYVDDTVNNHWVGQWTDSDVTSYVPLYEYAYATGQWYEQSATGGGFSTVGLAGQSASFIGDNHPLTLGTGSNWSYQYVDGVGQWTDSNVSSTVPLFEYVFATGQWYDQGVSGIAGSGFNVLGAAGQSASFIGDGTSLTPVTGWPSRARTAGRCSAGCPARCANRRHR